MERKLYPGIAFSPQTTLTENIGEMDTIINVSDASAFPEAPNLATIGIDEDGETILYTAKTATALSGCQRGIEGTPKAWKAGEIIGRNFTAKDHNDLIDSISYAYDVLAAKQPTITGNPGQLIGIGNDGTAAATVYPSNCNLLDNWYFADPVNQRGVTNYAKAASGDYSYFIDRWVYFKGIDSITLGSDGMTCSAAGTSYIWVAQPMEDKLFEFLKNRQVTMSALVKGHGKYGMGNLNETSTQMGTAINSDNFELISHTYTWPSADSETPNKYRSLYFGIEAGAVTVLAIKLELGSVQTLARKEGDTWVLNDPPPDKALELAKCQRYYERDFVDRGYGIADTNTGVSIFIPYRVPKRASATFVYDESKFSKALYCLNRNNLAYVPISSIKTVSADRSGCTLFVSAATVVGNIYILKSDCIAVDANL